MENSTMTQLKINEKALPSENSEAEDSYAVQQYMEKKGINNRVLASFRAKMFVEFLNSLPNEKRRSGKLSHSIDMIVADWLQKAGFEMSLSVFITEAGLTVSDIGAIPALLRGIPIAPFSPVGEALNVISRETNKKRQSFVYQFLSVMNACGVFEARRDKECEANLNLIEDKTCVLNSKLPSMLETHEQIFKQTEVEREISKFKNAYKQKELELKNTYEKKLNEELRRLLEKEKQGESKVFEDIKTREHENNLERTKIFAESERQAKWKYEQEMIFAKQNREISRREEVVFKKEETLKDKELELRRKESALVFRVEEKIHHIERTCTEKISEMQEKFERKEREFLDEVECLTNDSKDVKSYKQKQNALERRCKKAEDQFADERSKNIKLEKKEMELEEMLNDLREKIKFSSNIDELHKDLLKTKEKLSECEEQLKIELSEKQRVQRELKLLKAKPTPNFDQIQQELEFQKGKYELLHEHSVNSEKKYDNLKKRLKEEIKLRKSVIEKFKIYDKQKTNDYMRIFDKAKKVLKDDESLVNPAIYRNSGMALKTSNNSNDELDVIELYSAKNRQEILDSTPSEILSSLSIDYRVAHLQDDSNSLSKQSYHKFPSKEEFMTPSQMLNIDIKSAFADIEWPAPPKSPLYAQPTPYLQGRVKDGSPQEKESGKRNSPKISDSKSDMVLNRDNSSSNKATSSSSDSEYVNVPKKIYSNSSSVGETNDIRNRRSRNLTPVESNSGSERSPKKNSPIGVTSDFADEGKAEAMSYLDLIRSAKQFDGEEQDKLKPESIKSLETDKLRYENATEASLNASLSEDEDDYF